MDNKNYAVLAFYLIEPIEDPIAEVKLHKEFFKERDVMSRIYISEEGINGQMSALKEDAEAYREWMLGRSPFNRVHFKIHWHHEHAFPRQTVKYRKQLVAFDMDVDLSQRGEHVPPKKWKEMLESGEEVVLLDVRNKYEWDIGRFAGAECPPCETSRDFKQFTDDLLERLDKKNTPVMMYCTGGIRCEVYSALLKEKGVEKIFQLQGGVINYGLEEGKEHWEGKLFVFDDRLAIPINEEEPEVVGTCHHCKEPYDHYYNCANMDCNELFICCSNCLKTYAGCCQAECQAAPHVRPYHHQTTHKPFRRKHHYPEFATEKL